MSTTQSGRLLLPRNFAVPSLTDMAVQLGRIERFGGGARTWWTVLHHLHLCDAICIKTGLPNATRLVLLLHEADEVATGDIPTLWKTDDQREAVVALQRRAFEAYTGRLPTATEADTCKQIDLLALRLEMEAVGPPNVLDHGGLRGHPVDGESLKWGLARVVETATHYPFQPYRHNRNAPLAKWYLSTLMECGVRNPDKEAVLICAR
jgi:hypothetical protein